MNWEKWWKKILKHEIRFVDLFKFMASFLEKLVENLTNVNLANLGDV